MIFRLKSLAALCFLLFSGGRMYAAMTLFVEEPFGTFGALNPTGHAAVYFDRVCAETPTVLRRCRAGESGAVISRYHHIAGHDWVAVPLIPYLYAVDRPPEVPELADAETVASLRDAYRREHLRQFIPDGPEGDTPPGEWTQLVGASYDRRIYGVEIETTEAQDDRLIAELNAEPNHSHFNLFLRNCADFSRRLIDFDYPKAVRRSFSADMGITTPKQIAKALVSYGKHHPDLQVSVFAIPQVPGDLQRSHNIRGVCESLVRSKKYVVPLAILHPWVATGIVTGYLAGGRLNLARDAAPLPSTLQQPREMAAWLNSENLR
jgi:hypothetical protein